METLREFTATLIYTAGTVLVFSVIEDFHWGTFLGAFTCFIVSYFVWPSKKRGQRVQENLFTDILEFIIELPVEILMWVFRLIGRMFRNKDGGFDVDIDL